MREEIFKLKKYIAKENRVFFFSLLGVGCNILKLLTLSNQKLKATGRTLTQMVKCWNKSPTETVVSSSLVNLATN